MICSVAPLALALTMLSLDVRADEKLSSDARDFDWDRHYARQDAGAEKDRIAAQCAQGHCDNLALRQAQRACSAFGPLGNSSSKFRGLAKQERTCLKLRVFSLSNSATLR